jgi:membrane protease YdiL (CAAX protease family)
MADARAQIKFFGRKCGRKVKSRLMAESRRTHELNLWGVLAIWAALLLTGVLVGLHMGFGGWPFVWEIAVCSILLAGLLLPAAPRASEQILAWSHGSGALTVLVPLAAFVIYTLCVSRDWRAGIAGSAYVLTPTLLLAIKRSDGRASLLDYAAVLIVWLPVEFRWMYHLFPYPPPLTHTLTILLAVNAGLAAFVFTREFPGIGYAIEWRRSFAGAIGVNLALFSVIAIPLAEAIGFIHWDPSLSRLRSLPLFAVGIFVFTAWPEEFLFRGLLQNLLARSFRNQWVGLIVAAAIFGFSHILHAPFPNWKYVILATIAGIFYGLAWMKTGSLLPSAIVHGCVDVLWHLLFR